MSYPQPSGRRLLCPTCLDLIDWTDEQTMYAQTGAGEYEAVTVNADASPAKAAAAKRSAYVRCPNPSGDYELHYLPYLYGAFRPPIVIGFVGDSASGKTHLLAAMIGMIERTALAPYGLKADALDPAAHQTFLATYSNPLLDQGTKLGRTRELVFNFVDALLISSRWGTWPVAFFDVAGEDLKQLRTNVKFINAVNALVFVADPRFTDALADQDDTAALTLGRHSEHAFRAVLSQLHPGGGFLDTPAALVINKADQLRFLPPADRWLREGTGGGLDVDRVLAESRDGYAFLYQQGARTLLQPVEYCRRCTVHFASATGGAVYDNAYPHGVRPIRVVQPLVALLAMCGVLGTSAMAVGK